MLVRCYHGLGDTLMCARFLPRLRAVAAHVALEAPPALLPLLAGFAADCYPFDPAHPLPPAELDIEIMELLHALRIDAGDLLGHLPYLSTPPSHLPQGENIGLCAASGGWDAARDIPARHLVAACAGPGRLLHWLQPGQAPDGCINPPGAPSRLEDTAALIAALDLVVTADTMVAHLAGGLGRPALLLLRRQCDWRWQESGDTTPWYKSTILLRQETEGDWSAPLARLSALLATRAGSPRSPAPIPAPDPAPTARPVRSPAAE